MPEIKAFGPILVSLPIIVPELIDEFTLININADAALYAVDIPRDDFNNYMALEKTDALFESVKIYKPEPDIHYTHDYKPQPKLPQTIWKIAPAIRSQIGGPDGFYFGDLSLSIHTETVITRRFNVLGVASIGILNGFDDLKLASDSIIPHVRTDIVKYLKASTDYHITRLQANYFSNPATSNQIPISHYMNIRVTGAREL